MAAADGVIVEALVIILAVAASRWFNRHRHSGAPGDPLPGPPDPYAIAWLRGGAGAVLQLAAYDLVRGSRLALRPPGPAQDEGQTAPALIPLTPRAGEDDLPEAALRLLRLVTTACDRGRLAGFAMDLAPSFQAIDRTLRDHGLLLAPAQRAAGWAVTLLGMVAVLGVAFALLQDAAAGVQGDAVGIAALAAIGVAALRLLGAPEPRLSPRGRAALVRCAGEASLAGAPLRPARWIRAAAGGEGADGGPATSAAPGPTLLAVALGGMPVLQGTSYAGLAALLDPASMAPGPPRFHDACDGDGGQDVRGPDGDPQR